MGQNPRAIRLRVGRNVQRLRRLRGLSQEGLAERVGNTWKHIGQVERGEVNVSIDILSRTAAALGVDVSTLFMAPSRRRSDMPIFLITGRELAQLEHVARKVRSARALPPGGE